MSTPWRALLRRSTYLLPLAVLAAGCFGTSATSTPALPGIVQQQPAPAPEPFELMPVLQTGPTALERLARADHDMQARNQQYEELRQQLEAQKQRNAQADALIAERDVTIDKLRRQLADMDVAIADVRKELDASVELRQKCHDLEVQLEAAQDEVASRKKEMLELTLKLEDIYKVLISEFQARAEARDRGEFVVQPQ